MSDSLEVAYLMEVAGNPEVYIRSKLASELSEFLDDQEATDDERKAVVPVLMKLAEDESDVVRRSLLGGLRHCEHVPSDLIFAMAADIDDIAGDILKHTPALLDNELIAVIKISDDVRRGAIAEREGLSPAVCRALIEHGSHDVIRTLLDNAPARIDTSGYEAIRRRHSNLDSIENLLMKRRDLPPMLAIGLVDTVSNRLEELAAHKKWLRSDRAAQVIRDAKEEGVIRIISRSDVSENRNVVRELLTLNHLTPSLVLRAACVGKMDFVEEAFTCLAKMPPAMVHNMMFKRGHMGLKAIFLKSGLPGSMFFALRVAVDVYRELYGTSDIADEQHFGRRMIERILTQYEEFSEDDKTYLLSMLRRFAGAETRPLVDQILRDMSHAA